MPVGQPTNGKPKDWYEAAALCDENQITNAAFFSAKLVPTQHTTLVFQAPQMFLAAAPQAAPMPLPLPPVPNFPALTQFDRGKLTRKPVTGADNQVTFVATAYFVTTPTT
jgi:hypothetical protein